MRDSYWDLEGLEGRAQVCAVLHLHCFPGKALSQRPDHPCLLISLCTCPEHAHSGHPGEGVDTYTWLFSSLSHDSSFSVSLRPPPLSPMPLCCHPPSLPPAVPSLSSVLSPASVCSPVCVEVPSETEAVQGNPMKLRCISCMKREEVEATTVVEWFYRPEGGKDFLIYEYRNGHQEVESPFQGRLQWNGSKDLQDVSITVLNVTLNDSGLYTCNVSREFEFEAHRPFVKTTRLIPLRVTEEAGEDFTSVVSEIMMYILLVFLTLWLLIEMIYCYRKVSKAEEAAQENASDYLAIPSENKENSAVPVEE
nr:sodium channel subunit beta-3 isoform X1 [Microcebus murinus]XP_012645305.1 sodium channel subunit beta-3 isoform X1 [Microcebus murinus]